MSFQPHNVSFALVPLPFDFIQRAGNCHPQVKQTREIERIEYTKNKGRNGSGGEWWGHVEAKFEPSSCYKDSFKHHDYKSLRSITYSDSRGNAPPPLAGSQQDNSAAAEVERAFQKQWSKYRMRKPPAEEVGKHFDILTGRDLGPSPPGVHIPGRRAGRVSIDKLNAIKYGIDKSHGEDGKRNYDIISNAPLPVHLK
ncbi:hypothetical protein BC830DRAFT_912963 [Chytriomyces sp. MP71]|nr:hypothetical protein BC830DRAFT_912963 [Chytriomyces sp. MP71]